MPTYPELILIFKEFLPLLTIGGITLSAAKLIPRIGPGRAIGIALRSRFALKPEHECVRKSEIKLLKHELAEKDLNQDYFVITGEKGIGKTCLLETVTSKTPGVIRIDAQPSQTADTIVNNTLKKLADPPFKFMDPLKTAPKVILWYRLFTFGRSPIVVINAVERIPGEKYAGITGAARTLVDEYKLRVVIDGSPNSLHEYLFHTNRERVFEIKPMTKDMIWEISQFEEFFKYVKEADLEDTVYAVLGGNPSKYGKLWKNSKNDLMKGMDPRKVIGTHLCAVIYDAIKIIKSQKIGEIIKLFDKDKNMITFDLLEANNLERPTPDKVFREVEQDDKPTLVPASNAIGIVLRHGLNKKPSLEELERLIKT